MHKTLDILLNKPQFVSRGKNVEVTSKKNSFYPSIRPAFTVSLDKSSTLQCTQLRLCYAPTVIISVSVCISASLHQLQS